MSQAAALPARGESGSHLAGIGCVLLANFVFGASNVLAKWSMVGYPQAESLLIRCLAALLFLTPFLRMSNFLAAARSSPRLHLTRAALSALELNCYYWAITSLQLADVSAFYLSSPILVTAISAAALGERVDGARWVAVFVGFGGVLVALRPSSGAISWPALIALFGSIVYALVLVSTRRLRASSNTVLVALQLLALLLVSAVAAPFHWITPGWDALVPLSAVGVVSLFGSLLTNRALQLAPASVIAPFQYASILWAIVMGYLAFGDMPRPTMLAGAAVIIVAGYFILPRERAARCVTADASLRGSGSPRQRPRWPQ